MFQHRQILEQQQAQAMQAAEAVKGTDQNATKAVVDSEAFGPESSDASQPTQVSPAI
jgi:hypothetical protein